MSVQLARGFILLLAVLARSRKSRKLIPAGFFSGCGDIINLVDFNKVSVASHDGLYFRWRGLILLLALCASRNLGNLVDFPLALLAEGWRGLIAHRNSRSHRYH